MSGTYVVNVGGVGVVIEAGTLDITNEIGQRSQCTFTVKTAAGVHWEYGAQVQIYDDVGALRYAGFVETDQATKPGFGAVLEHAVTCMDMHYLADKRLAFQSYLAANAGDIVKSLWSLYLQPEGVALGPIATGLQIPEVVWNGEQVSKALDWLAQQCGYWWQIDENKQLWFQPYGGVGAPFTLDGSQVAQNDKLSCTYGNRQYRNRQFLVGGKDRTATLTETFHGDGVKRAFTLSYPIGSIVYVTLNGALQSLGVKGVDNGEPFYYAVSDAVLAQDPSNAILGAGDTLVVKYKGEYPVVALAQNSALISTQQSLEGGGTGYVEAKEHNAKVHTLDAGFQIAQAELAHYGQGMTTLVWSTLAANVRGLAQGQLLSVNLPDFALSEAMLVRSVELTDNTDSLNMWAIVTCIGSPYDVSWQTFFQNLMNQAGASDVTDAANQATQSILAAITQTQLSVPPTIVAVTGAYAICPICGPATLCSNTLIVC